MIKTSRHNAVFELRGFAPIGVLEYWNNGMMGMKEFYQLKYDLFLFYYPLFHYSSILTLQLSMNREIH